MWNVGLISREGVGRRVLGTRPRQRGVGRRVEMRSVETFPIGILLGEKQVCNAIAVFVFWLSPGMQVWSRTRWWLDYSSLKSAKSQW
jgi:hypothetical protein